MCNCNKNLGNIDINEYQQEKVISPLPKPFMSTLNGLDMNIGIIDVVIWAGIFYAGHKFGKSIFGKK